ncbi:MAG: hypothetical protein JKY87_04725 [Mariprofundus sp.]|nr:hypothetical protein [Mariprofundus sp.]
MKSILFIVTLFAFALPASSSDFFTSIEDRTETMNAQLQGNNSYHAHLARELASVAEDEKAQHDSSVAKEFMHMAEQHAAQAGGAQ